MLNVLAGDDPRDPACQDRPVPNHARGLEHGIRGLRVGVIDNHFMDRNAPPVQACVEVRIADLQREGASVTHFTMPILAYGLGAIYAIELASSGAYHDRWVAEGRSTEYQADVRALVEMGRLVSAVDYLKAEQVRTLMAEEFKRLFEQVDVIVTPTEPITAWQRGPRDAVDPWTGRERAGGLVAPDLPVQPDRAAGDLGALRIRRRGPAHRAADCRPPLR